MEQEIVIEGVPDAVFALDLIGEAVEEVRWPFDTRAKPYDWQTDGVTASNQQGVDHENRIDPAYAGRFYDYGVGIDRAAA